MSDQVLHGGLYRFAEDQGYQIGSIQRPNKKQEYDYWLYWTEKSTNAEFIKACDRAFRYSEDFNFIDPSSMFMRSKDIPMYIGQSFYRSVGNRILDDYKMSYESELGKTDKSGKVRVKRLPELMAKLSSILYFENKITTRINRLDDLMRRVLKVWLWHAWSIAPEPREGTEMAKSVEGRFRGEMADYHVSVTWEGNPVPHWPPATKRNKQPPDLIRRKVIREMILEEVNGIYLDFRKGNKRHALVSGEGACDDVFRDWSKLEVLADAQRRGVRFLYGERLLLAESEARLEPERLVVERALWSAVTSVALPPRAAEDARVAYAQQYPLHALAEALYERIRKGEDPHDEGINSFARWARATTFTWLGSYTAVIDILVKEGLYKRESDAKGVTAKERVKSMKAELLASYGPRRQ